MSEIKRYDTMMPLYYYKESDSGNMVTYLDHISSHALLEARCKELESALPMEKLLKMKMACERLISPCTANMAGRSVNMMSILDAQAVYHSIVDTPSILKLVEAAISLSTPTTDEHLQKLFVEWLGEPVGECVHQGEGLWVRILNYTPLTNKTKVYAPKKVSE